MYFFANHAHLHYTVELQYVFEQGTQSANFLPIYLRRELPHKNRSNLCDDSRKNFAVDRFFTRLPVKYGQFRENILPTISIFLVQCCALSHDDVFTPKQLQASEYCHRQEHYLS